MIPCLFNRGSRMIATAMESFACFFCCDSLAIQRRTVVESYSSSVIAAARICRSRGLSSSGFSSGNLITRSFCVSSKTKAMPSLVSFRLTVGSTRRGDELVDEDVEDRDDEDAVDEVLTVVVFLSGYGLWNPQKTHSPSLSYLWVLRPSTHATLTLFCLCWVVFPTSSGSCSTKIGFVMQPSYLRFSGAGSVVDPAPPQPVEAPELRRVEGERW